MTRDAHAVFTSFAESPRVEADGAQVATLLAATETGGRSVVQEIRCAPGRTIDPLGDATVHRYLYVLGGDFEIVVGDDRRACSPHTTIVAPRDMVCSGRVTGTIEGRMLVLSFPA